jgi:hypothetical protein
MNIEIDPKFDEEAGRDLTAADGSISSDVEEDSSDKESVEDNVIFEKDGRLDEQR